MTPTSGADDAAKASPDEAAADSETIVLKPGTFGIQTTLFATGSTVLTAGTQGGTSFTLLAQPSEQQTTQEASPRPDGRWTLYGQPAPVPSKRARAVREGPLVPTVSLCLNHAPFAHEREPMLHDMMAALELRDGHGPRGPFWVHDIDYRQGGTVGKGQRVDFTLNQWRWAVAQPTTHHAFATDDLKLVPRFWEVLDSMLQVVPDDVLGLLSNHPEGPALAAEGHRWYASNSWVVGPMYVLPHDLLVDLLEWPGTRIWDARNHGWSDDATLNAWITYAGPGRAIHPLPTPIEHDPEGLMSTWSHTGCGDAYSRERLSWRKYAAQARLDEATVAEAMLDVNFWRASLDVPLLPFPEPE